jgi:hypothetical protein
VIAKGRAESTLRSDVDVFEGIGYRALGDPSALAARLRAPTGGIDVILRMSQRGRIFGGDYGLEITTAEPLLPATRGLRARGRGMVRMSGVRFHARRGDEVGGALAARLSADERLAAAFREVHFEQLAIDPDGRAMIRHMGGSVVWLLVPPLVRATPLLPEQARASVAALEAIAGVSVPGN